MTRSVAFSWPIVPEPNARHLPSRCRERTSHHDRVRADQGHIGALWAGLGAAATSAGPLPGALVALVVAALVVAAWRVRRANPAVADAALPADLAARLRRGSRVLLWSCVGEGVGILLAVNLVVNLGHPQWQTAAVMAVVGLHFLPLARGFGYRAHVVTGVAMTAWALAYPWLFAAGALSPVGPLVAGAMLFASAAWALGSGRA